MGWKGRKGLAGGRWGCPLSHPRAQSETDTQAQSSLQSIADSLVGSSVNPSNQLFRDEKRDFCRFKKPGQLQSTELGQDAGL